jgi:hypothetical protein
MRKCVLVEGVLFCCLMAVSPPAIAWNAPAHMVTGAMAHRILQHEYPATLIAVANLLKRHPWYVERWQRQVASRPESDH